MILFARDTSAYLYIIQTGFERARFVPMALAEMYIIYICIDWNGQYFVIYFSHRGRDHGIYYNRDML